MTSKQSTQKPAAIALGAIIVLSVLILADSSQSFAARQTVGRVKVMTWNISDGANLAPLASATTPPQFFAAVATVYNGIEATNFPERADAIAKQVEIELPDIIGVQEAILLRTQTPADGPATPASDVAYDYLELLLDSLEEKDLHYHVAVAQTGTDIEAPGLFPTGLKDVRLTDRDAILVRDDAAFTVDGEQSAQFSAVHSQTTAIGSVSFPKSWVSAELTFASGEKAKVISTHLEPLSPTVQVAQGAELLSGPADTELPLILIGDFNSKADSTGTPTYGNLISAGFTDAWTVVGKGNGVTCCQDPTLDNSASQLNARIDYVLYEGSFEVKQNNLVGESTKDKTGSGLWPSDHAGVVTDLKLTAPS